VPREVCQDEDSRVCVSSRFHDRKNASRSSVYNRWRRQLPGGSTVDWTTSAFSDRLCHAGATAQFGSFRLFRVERVQAW